MTQPTNGDVACPNCGTSNRIGARFCRKCGATLPGASPAGEPSSSSPEPSATDPASQAAAPTMRVPRPVAEPRSAAAAPPLADPPAAEPARRGFPWVLLLIVAGAGLLLLTVCVGGALWFVTANREVTVAPTPVVAEVTAEPAPTGEPALAPDAAPTLAPTEAQPAPTTAPEQPDVAATAAADTEATRVAEQQTALAGPTAAPTAPPPPPVVELAPAPGTLALTDYQAGVGAYSQRLFETFDRGERTKAIWSQFDNENVAARLRNNFYALTLKGDDKNMWEVWDQDLGSDYNVELSVAFENPGTPATVGIAFDVQAEGDNGVFFEVYNDKHWQLRTVQDGRLVRELTTGRIPLPELQDGVGTNVLWVVRKPDQVQLWINSIHVATVPASPFPGGRAGVIAASRSGLSAPSTVIADNFRVRTP